MKKIGFKNFRKFKEFPPIDLTPITIFVGENNAGKSTVVKGILALSDFLNDNNVIQDTYLRLIEIDEDESREETNKKLLKNIRFSFNKSYLAHIGTFKRALCNKTNEKKITFSADLDYINVSITVKGDPNNVEAVSGTVSLIEINLSPYNIDMVLDLESDNAVIVFNPSPKKEYKDLSAERIKYYYKAVDKEMSFHAKISRNWMPFRGNLIQSFIYMFEDIVDASLLPQSEMKVDSDDLFLREMCEPFEHISKDEYDFLKRVAGAIRFGSSSREGNSPRFRLMGLMGGRLSRMTNIEYLYAHAVTQTVIYSAKDTNDYLSLTVHEFAPHQRTKHKRNFVLKWMREFGVGNDFTIESVGGEAHIVYIIQDGEKLNLADKGMGSIQLMVLLFRLAISLGQRGMQSGGLLSKKVVIIEEPEQNLHPMLQSKLADLFLELSQEYGFNFIIETHSEYLIRKTQVLVSEQFNTDEKFKKNPFKVYYFPSEDVPYEVVYRPNGRFENAFGPGFFDEASSLTFKLF